MYPAFVNCTTIDWFTEWPQDALLEVANKYIENLEMANEDEVSFFTLSWSIANIDKLNTSC